MAPMDNPDIHVLETAPTDAVLAADYRKRMIDALGPIATVMAEANAHKMKVLFNMSIDAAGRGVISSLEILKVL
jgi:hypothetical protein